MNYCLFVLVESSSVKIACRYGCPFFMYWATIVWLLVGRCMVMSSLWELPVRLTQIFGLVSSLSLFIAWTYLSCIFFGELNEEWTKCAYKGIKNSKAMDKYDYIRKIEKLQFALRENLLKCCWCAIGFEYEKMKNSRT